MLSRVLRTPFLDLVEPRDLEIRLTVNPRDPFQLEMWLGAYQPHVVAFLRHAIQPGDRVLVAGTHVGYVATLAARLTGPRGVVVTAEPDPSACECAKKNLSLLDTRAAPVHLLEAGLSNESATKSLHQSHVLGHSSFAAPHHADGTTSVRVSRGDEWLTGLGIDALDVIVLDVEGWECHALQGLSAVIERSANLKALIEVSEWALRDAGRSVAELFQWLDRAGFEVRWAQHLSGPFGVSGPPATAANLLAGDVVCIRRPRV
jgi:FkbM family methyltransferase